MGQIEDLQLFAAIVEQGSISKAAEQLRIAKSAVSRRLSLLEQRYEARLIDREPGHWAITAKGVELHQRALDVLTHVEEFEDDFRQANQSLAGPLMVSLPREFGLSFLSGALMDFKSKHPEIQLMVDFDDRLVDLSRENYDCAIRVTIELEANIKGRQIGSSEISLCASPSYLAQRGQPLSLQDLAQHDLLQFQSARRAVWTFKPKDGAARRHEFKPTLNSNSGFFLRDAAIQGLGIARLPNFICQPAISAGELLPILSDLASPPLNIYLIHAENRRLNRRMRLFAEEMARACVGGL